MYSEDREHIKKIGENWNGEVYGICPVEGVGFVQGYRWYFRARGSRWTLEIQDHPEFSFKDQYGVWPSAGYMPYEDAWNFIMQSLEKFIKRDLNNKIKEF